MLHAKFQLNIPSGSADKMLILLILLFLVMVAILDSQRS